MIKYQLLKRDKFLQNCSSFLLVSFSANKQVNFLNFKEFLYTNNLKIKFLKSKSIKGCLQNYIHANLLNSLKTVSSCPLFIIKSKNESEFLNNFSNIDQKFFMDNKIFLMLCFYRGKTYFPRNLFLLKDRTPTVLVQTFYSFYLNLFVFFNICDLFLLKLLVVYLKLSSEEINL